ncbi:hypothetical protein MtrunA17_Chr8g0361291 [Medicago truncatula]|uniref:Uncharacterized protein n=1 Tax=Medicago truncatula TaxID=3880 RepID=A0A396GJ22_MEDTR|nr:hypothetical protein MtrunA17_Chr8g0361291 [Medicago truncatula]
MDGNVPTCECVKGYVPKFPQQWQISYQSNGFLRYCKMKFPDTSSSWFSKIMDLEECRTCSAYANLDICDFRLAQTLLGDDVEANTKRVAGTYG